MRQTTGTRKSPGEKLVKDIKRATTARQGHAKHDPQRGEGISQGIYYKWSKHCPAAHVFMHERGLHGSWQAPVGWRYYPCGKHR
jgi:hypothetical protein